MASKNRHSKKVESTDLAVLVAGEIASALTYKESELDPSREQALNYSRGHMPDLITLPNRSRLTSRDVADVISWMLPGVTRTLVGGSKVVEYEPATMGSEQFAKDATEFMNYDFMVKNHGYKIVRDATDDALRLKFAIVSSYWKPKETKRETIKRLTAQQIAMLVEDENIEILTAKELDETEDVEVQDEATGQYLIIAEPLYDVKVERTVNKGRIVDEVCKPENFLISGRATSIPTARSCGYLYDDLTRSDLMSMADEYGFDTEIIKELPADGISTDDAVALARYADSYPDETSLVRSMDPINLYRYYVYADVDDDGIAELLQVWYAGSKVLSWDVWEDDIPYTDIPCYPMSHRFDGESAADRVMDIQRVKTVLTRQMADNLYASNLPMKEIEVGSVLNPDILANPIFGGNIWKAKASAPIVWQTVPFVADKVMAALPYFDEVTARRTGVSKTTMALDPDALQNQTATANQNARDAAYSQNELVARDMAEYGWAPFFSKRLKLAVKYHQVPIAIPVDDGEEFKEVNPSEWPDDMAVSINTGLGTGSKDRDMAMLNVILQNQKEMALMLAQNGMSEKALELIPKIRKTAVALTEASGIRNPESWWPGFDDQDVLKAIQKQAEQAQQPNPAIQLEQMKQQGDQQLEQVKGQTQIQIEQVKAQVSQQESQAKAQVEIVKNQAQLEGDLAAQAAQRETSIAIETMKQDREDARFYAKLASEERIRMSELTLKAQTESARLAQTEANAKVMSEPNGAMQ